MLYKKKSAATIRRISRNESALPAIDEEGEPMSSVSSSDGGGVPDLDISALVGKGTVRDRNGWIFKFARGPRARVRVRWH